MASRSLFVLIAGSFLAGSVVFAQQTEPAPTQQPGAAAAQHQRRPIPPPTNLKVLPRDLTGEQVVAIMRHFEGDLGVECTYCHAKDPATNRPNFASDANPMKDRARVMIKMATAINTDYLTQLTDPKPEHPVTCGTCHQGMAEPPVFVPKPHEHEHPSGPPPAAGGEAPHGR
ncbi:MAG TPA: c-type cytochrome [Acidobacteriaceae bacterium]|nr:c-type cytochrome [Acidobacteriaceae bacterium]